MASMWCMDPTTDGHTDGRTECGFLRRDWNNEETKKYIRQQEPFPNCGRKFWNATQNQCRQRFICSWNRFDVVEKTYIIRNVVTLFVAIGSISGIWRHFIYMYICNAFVQIWRVENLHFRTKVMRKVGKAYLAGHTTKFLYVYFFNKTECFRGKITSSIRIYHLKLHNSSYLLHINVILM